MKTDKRKEFMKELDLVAKKYSHKIIGSETTVGIPEIKIEFEEIEKELTRKEICKKTLQEDFDVVIICFMKRWSNIKGYSLSNLVEIQKLLTKYFSYSFDKKIITQAEYLMTCSYIPIITHGIMQKIG